MSASSNIIILKSFKENLLTFLDELITQLPNEGDLILIRIFINDQIPIEKVMDYFIKKIIPLKTLIKERNASFFLENNVLSLSEKHNNKINHFKRIWRSNVLDNHDKETIFKWFDTFIFLAEKYQNSIVSS